jgi:hypothetical protein
MHAETASDARRASEGRWVTAVAALSLLLATGPLAAADWYVLCETGSGQVVLAQEVNREDHVVLMGPLPGPRTATAWLDTNCPSRRCDAAGQCLQPGESRQPAAAKGGWEVGKLTTVSLGGSNEARSAGGGPVGVTGPASLSGPGATDLTPLINTAKAAVAGCSYPAALAAADQMTNFDPNHPWLKANHDKLRRLAARQRTTRQAVWRASSALQAGKLKEAHRLAMSAADTAVSCQTQAVSALVTGIGTAIQQRSTERQLARRRAAAALLPGLLDLARVASGGHAAAGSPVSTVGTAIQSAAPAAGGVDPCAFKLEFPDRTSLVPVCGCPGYVFDVKRFRCAPG